MALGEEKAVNDSAQEPNETQEPNEAREEHELLDEGELEGLLADKEALKPFEHLKDGRKEFYLTVYGPTADLRNTTDE